MTVAAQFQDRREAGRFLAAKLQRHAGNPSVLVLALPPDGVPVAYEVASALAAPLDVFLLEKLFAPGYEELALGAVASGGVRILNEEAFRHLGISENQIATLAQERERELQRRERVYRGGRKPEPIEGRTILLVADGLNIGTNMRVALQALRVRCPKSVTIAVPIGSADTCRQLEREADEVVCPMAPEPLYSVGAWYSDFIQITDEEANRLLAQAADEWRARRASIDRASIQEDLMA
jgi:putative phosphoribosyl transferase